MSGTGKTTVLDELDLRGHTTVDTDYDGWVLSDGTWDEQRMDRLLSSQPDVIVSGTVQNQGLFYDRFEHVVLLSAPVEVLIERVRSRSNNPYGKTSQEQAEIAGYAVTVEPLLRQGSTLELDARRPPSELADAVEELLTRSPEGRTALTRADAVQQVVAAARERASALAAADAERLAALLHEDFRWTSHLGETFTRTQYVSRNTDGPTHWHSQDLTDVEVAVAGDTAVLHAEVTDVVRSGDGEPTTYRMPMTQVWVRVGGGWQCLAGHAGPRRC
jgi:ketosteroid isomerase-like protein